MNYYELIKGWESKPFVEKEIVYLTISLHLNDAALKWTNHECFNPLEKILNKFLNHDDTGFIESNIIKQIINSFNYVRKVPLAFEFSEGEYLKTTKWDDKILLTLIEAWNVLMSKPSDDNYYKVKSLLEYLRNSQKEYEPPYINSLREKKENNLKMEGYRLVFLYHFVKVTDLINDLLNKGSSPNNTQEIKQHIQELLSFNYSVSSLESAYALSLISALATS